MPDTHERQPEQLRKAVIAAGVALWVWNVDTDAFTMDDLDGPWRARNHQAGQPEGFGSKLMRRTVMAQLGGPPRVDYTLTPLGHSLAQALAPLCDWGSDNMDAVARIFAERDGWASRQAS